MMNKVLLHEIVMPNYIRKVKLSEHRRTHYLELKGPRFVEFLTPGTINEEVKDNLDILITSKPLGKSMKRGLISGEYIFKERVKKKPLCLFNTKTNEFVIINPRTAGTEKWEVISGQQLYNQGYHPFVRKKIMEQIHEYMTPFLIGLTPIIEYPISIEYFFHTKIDDRGDVDNYALPYYKCFQDCLVQTKVIENDTWKHISGFSVSHVDSLIDRLVVNIWKH